MVSPAEGDALFSIVIPVHSYIRGWPLWETSLWMAGEWPAVTRAPELLEMAASSANTWAVQGIKVWTGGGSSPALAPGLEWSPSA